MCEWKATINCRIVAARYLLSYLFYVSWKNANISCLGRKFIWLFQGAWASAGILRFQPIGFCEIALLRNFVFAFVIVLLTVVSQCGFGLNFSVVNHIYTLCIFWRLLCQRKVQKNCKNAKKWEWNTKNCRKQKKNKYVNKTALCCMRFSAPIASA